MHEIEYLTEKDLQYFRKKAANGEPVYILHLDPEVLVNLDTDSLGTDAGEDGEMTAEEMSYWLSRHHALISEAEAEKQAQEREKEKEAAGNAAAGDDKTGNGGSSRQEEKPIPPQPSARELFLQLLKKGEFSTMESYILQDAVSSGFTDSALLALCSYKGDPEAMMRYYSAVMKKMREGGDAGEEIPPGEDVMQ